MELITFPVERTRQPKRVETVPQRDWRYAPGAERLQHGAYGLVQTESRRRLVTAELFRQAKRSVVVCVDCFDSDWFGAHDVAQAMLEFLERPDTKLELFIGAVRQGACENATAAMRFHPRTRIRIQRPKLAHTEYLVIADAKAYLLKMKSDPFGNFSFSGKEVAEEFLKIVDFT